MARSVATQVNTNLSVKEAAHVFEVAVEESRGAGSKFSGALSKMKGNGGVEYFELRKDGVFGSLDDHTEYFAVAGTFQRADSSCRVGSLQ